MRGRLGLVASVLLWAAPVAGQEPPGPVARPEIALPEVAAATLPNGLELLTVWDPDTRWVTVEVLVRGGRGADPVGRSGLSQVVAGALSKGTANRSGREITDSIDALGATLTTSVSSDWISISLGVLSPFLDQALGLLSDLLIHPTFPVLEVERVKGQALAAIGGGWSEPGTTAGRVLARSVYGDHPYGAAGVIEGLGEVLVTDVRQFHSRNFRPERTLVVVTGEADPGEAEALVGEHLGAWTGSGRVEVPPPPELPEGPSGAVLVHQPGSTRAVIAIGHALPAADAADWTALGVANQLLGGPSGRLATRFAEHPEWAGGAASSVSRRLDQGLLQLRADVRAEVADSAIAGMLEALGGLRERPPGEPELSGIVTSLLRSMPLQRETAQQIGSGAARHRMLNLPLAEWLETEQRLQTLGSEAVRLAAERHLDPARAVVVVVGDATLLRPRLAAFGPLRVEDIEGATLTLADLAPPSVEVDWRTERLRPGRWTYRISADGRPMGSLSRSLVASEVDGRRVYDLRSSMETGPQLLEQQVRFIGSSFEPISSSFELSMGGASVLADLEVGEEGVRGRRVLGDGQEIPFEAPAFPGALLGEMVEVALWLLPLEEGLTLSLPIMQVQSGAIARVSVRVLGRVRTTVPAGSFDTFMIEISGDQGTQVAYALVRSPHVVVRLESVGESLVLELESSSGRVPD
jgi:zinc protease